MKTWVQVGQTLIGNAVNSGFGSSIQLNSNGDIIIVGSTFDSNEGRVYVYQLIGDSWTQIGGTVLGFEETGCGFGSSVSINDTGNVIACGAKFALNGTDYTGGVKLYLLYSGIWTQIGPDLLGESNLDEFGAVALDASGTNVAVGAPKNGTYGSVTAYGWDGTSHTQVGSKVSGSARIDSNNGSGELFGSRVALSDNGLIFLSHSSEKNIIYEFTTDWAIKGSQLGTTFTTSVSNAGLSGDGQGIVVLASSSSPESFLIVGEFIVDWTPYFTKDFDGIGDGIVKSLAFSKDGNCVTAINAGANATLYTFKRIISQADLTFFEPNGVDILARLRAVQSTTDALASDFYIEVKDVSGVSGTTNINGGLNVSSSIVQQENVLNTFSYFGYSVIGNVRNQTNTSYNEAGFCHRNYIGWDTFALSQDHNGNTQINSKPTGYVALRLGWQSKMTITGSANYSYSHFLPAFFGTLDLGSTGFKWRTVYATVTSISSDDRLKINERPIPDALKLISNLNYYEYERVQTLDGKDVTGTDRGVIAQQLLNTDISFAVQGGGHKM